MSSCFFFSSRRRHTRYWRDWSSDVCSSDLPWSSPPGLKRSQAEQGQPVRVALAGHQLPRALALARGMPAAQEAAVVPEEAQQIGRASCRERVEISVVAVSLKKKNQQIYTHS